MVDAVVADHRRRAADELLGEARIGADLLIARHGGREDSLTARKAGSADRLAAEDGPVLQHQHPPCRHPCTTAPFATVISTRLLSVRPRSHELAERERKNPCSVTRVTPARSRSTTFALTPAAIRGRSSPKMRAGPADRRASSVCSGRWPGWTSSL